MQSLCQLALEPHRLLTCFAGVRVKRVNQKWRQTAILLFFVLIHMSTVQGACYESLWCRQLRKLAFFWPVHNLHSCQTNNQRTGFLWPSLCQSDHMVSHTFPAGWGWRWVTPCTSLWLIAGPPTGSHTHTYRPFRVAKRPRVHVCGWWEEACREPWRNIQRTYNKGLRTIQTHNLFTGRTWCDQL